MSDCHCPTLAPEWASYCINPKCQHRQNPETERFCQTCGTPLFVGDRYRLVSPIGELDRSRRTEIFEVEDWGIRASDRHTPKLLKVLKPTDNPLWIRLFEQEFRVLTALRHPGIPQVDAYSFFPFALSDGTTVRCLVMEKIQGINLEQWIAQNGPISPELALNWLQQLAKILEFAHGKGFFHRDVKPANIMRRPNGKLVLFVFLGILGVGQEFILPQIALKLNEWGYERYVSDRYEAAEFYYQWALKFQPDFDSARYSLGATCEKLGKMDCAYANYQTARQSASDRVAAAAMNNLGRLQILNQNYESAIKLLLSALKRADETAIASDLYKNLGWVYLLQGQYPEAQSHLGMAISLNPEKPHAYCLLARALSDTGDQIAAQSIGKICHLRYDPKDKQPEIETWIPFPSQGTRATNITEQQ